MENILIIVFGALIILLNSSILGVLIREFFAHRREARQRGDAEYLRSASDERRREADERRREADLRRQQERDRELWKQIGRNEAQMEAAEKINEASFNINEASYKVNQATNNMLQRLGMQNAAPSPRNPNPTMGFSNEPKDDNQAKS